MKRFSAILVILLSFLGFTSIANAIDTTNTIKSSSPTDDGPGSNRRIDDWKKK